MSIGFKDNYLGSNILFFKISQHGEQTDMIDVKTNNKKIEFKIEFKIESSISTFLFGEGHREFQIDIYGLNDRTEQLVKGEPLAAQSALVPDDERILYSFAADFSIPENLIVGTNLQFSGADLFFKVESMKDGKPSYSPIFRTIIPLSSSHYDED